MVGAIFGSLNHMAANATLVTMVNTKKMMVERFIYVCSRLTKKAEPPPTRGVNRDSGTANGNGGWLRRLVRPHGHILDILLPVFFVQPYRFKMASRKNP